MRHHGHGMPEYEGQETKCTWCDVSFKKGDLIILVPLGLAFCYGKRGLACLGYWRFAHDVEEIDFKTMEFKGRDSDGSSDELALI